MISLTILNHNTFCKSVGLNQVVSSDFPIENRPIYLLSIAYLNYDNFQLQEVIKYCKSIQTIHITSYKELNIIKGSILEQMLSPYKTSGFFYYIERSQFCI